MMDAQAQEQHRWLQQLLGDWTSTSSCDMGPDQPKAESSGSEHVRALGDLWVTWNERTLTSFTRQADGS